MIDIKADVHTPEFYKERIRQAISSGLIHQSVYHCPLGVWEHIQGYTEEVITREMKDCKTILDIGCAYGPLIECLENINPILYLGIDRSPEFIQIARAFYPCCKYSFRAHECKGERFFTETYDWAVMREMTAHYQGNVEEMLEDKVVQFARKNADKVLILNYSAGYESFVLDGIGQ